MSAAENTANSSTPTLEALRAENAELRGQLDALKQQLEWFKRQLFGRKSEKRLVQDGAEQFDFGTLFAPPPQETAPTEQVTYTRRTGKVRPEACVTDAGLRFDASVPVEVIEIPAPELSGPNAEQYELVDYKVTRRLAQRPGSYVVLEYRRAVVKDRLTEQLRTTPAPQALFDQAMADVSFVAGMLVDKFVYHLPLYRQHQRLRDAGIEMSRGTLTHYVQRAIALLVPI